MAASIKYPKRPLRFRLVNRLVRYMPIAAKYGHNSILLQKKLSNVEHITIPAGYDFRLADQQDLDFIAGHAEALRAGVYANRLRRGDRCYCLCMGREILSYNWVASSLGCVMCGFEHGLEFLPLKEGQVFTYDFYTYKSRRGGGLGSLTKRLLLQELVKQGIREVFTLVMPYSTVSLKIHLSAGYQPQCMVYGYRLWHWSRTFFGRPEDKSWLDAWIDNFKVTHGISGDGLKPENKLI